MKHYVTNDVYAESQTVRGNRVEVCVCVLVCNYKYILDLVQEQLQESELE